MDTRSKIIPFDEVGNHLDKGKWIAVAGTFDPLTVEQARRLANYANGDRKLLVMIESGAECLLAADARAALVAALRAVHAVTVAPAPQKYRFLAEHQDVQVVVDPEGERRRTAEFKDFVIRRQSS